MKYNSLEVCLLLMNAGIAIIFMLIGYVFIKSNGKASKFIAGYNSKSELERKQFDEIKLCNDFGRRFIIWAVCFVIGIVLDYFFVGYGTILAWAMWTILFIWHFIDMNKNEERYRRKL